MPEYIRWDAKGVENEQPGEKEKIKEVSEQFSRFQMMNFDDNQHALRGTHLKTQGVRHLSYPRPSLIFAVRRRQVHRPGQSATSSRTRHVQSRRHIRCHHEIFLLDTQTRPR
jgi:hypothetical protein